MFKLQRNNPNKYTKNIFHRNYRKQTEEKKYENK